MKKIYLFLLSFIVITMVSCTTTLVPVEDISSVVEVENTSKEELFVKANLWMTNVFNDSKSVVELSYKDLGIIKGKFFLNF